MDDDEWVSSPNDECLQCGQTRGDVYSDTPAWPCETEPYWNGLYEEGGSASWPRHRWKPWSEAELARQKAVREREAAEINRQLGDMAEFFGGPRMAG